MEAQKGKDYPQHDPSEKCRARKNSETILALCVSGDRQETHLLTYLFKHRNSQCKYGFVCSFSSRYRPL